MKKMIFCLACASLCAASATAQLSLVKDLAKAAGSSKIEELTSVLTQITPALTNGESASDVLTWYTAGKASFGLFDQLQAKKLMGQAVDSKQMADALLNGYTYFNKALPLDTVVEVNKDGTPKIDKKTGLAKVKTKYSKDILATLTSHIGDVAGVGDACREAENWTDAAKAYGYFCDLSSSDVARNAGVNMADTLIGQVRFLQGYSLYNNKDFAGAAPLFKKALDLGYTDNNTQGFLNDSFIKVVQNKLEANDRTGAMEFVDQAIAEQPNNSIFYDIKAQLYLQDEKADEALPLLKKAIEIDPTNPDCQFNYGRALCEKAQKFINDNQKLSNSQLAKTVVPLYEEAKPYLDKAEQLAQPDNETLKSNVNRYREDIDYKLGILKGGK